MGWTCSTCGCNLIMWAAPDKGGYEVIDGMIAFDTIAVRQNKSVHFADCELELVRQVMES